MVLTISAEEGARSAGARARLAEALSHAAHCLPAQGPIGVFVHHNTLHAHQHLPFEQAVAESGRLRHAEPYLAEETYREALRSGRILAEDIDDVVGREPDACFAGGRVTRRQFRRALLLAGAREVPAATVPWHLEDGDWLLRFRDGLPAAAATALAGDSPRALWKACHDRVPAAPLLPVRFGRPAEAVAAKGGADLDAVIHPLLIRLCGAFLDQGVAYWPMPHREEGLFRAAVRLLSQPAVPDPPGLLGMQRAFACLAEEGREAEDALLDSLEALGVPENCWEEYLRTELLALPGWPGMMRQLEEHPELAPHVRLPCALADFTALRLALTVVALRNLPDPLDGWRRETAEASGGATLAQAAMLFDAAQVLGLTSAMLSALPPASFNEFATEVVSFDGWERRRLLHLAFERRHERQVLLPLIRHLKEGAGSPRTHRLTAQVVFCIDDREESMRRALEEVDGSIETFGAAGFFGCAMDYVGIDDGRFAAFCPVVVKPVHAVREQAVPGHEALGQKRRTLRRWWSRWKRVMHVSSQTLVRGSVSTAVLGFISLFPLVWRVLSPLSYARLARWLSEQFFPEPRTELRFMREDTESREATTGLLRGFTVPEMVDRVAGVLGPAGLRVGHARLLLVLGHGSSSLNNPHESAYDCGACGGRKGGPNARLFALMANHEGVRRGLRSRGICIPDDTRVVGGFHDTCTDDVILYDLEALPASHGGDLDRVSESLERARALNARERARRFEAADRQLGPAEALRHVCGRAVHLGEPRPELGHATNAVAFVGHRQTTAGLFLDRRAFLVSYDHRADPEARVLAELLNAAVPICAGINLEYFFSRVDNEAYGCGTKLPLNVTGLIGVMAGTQSDLRTGLPWQMVEVHEAVRLLLVIENEPDVVLAAFRSNPMLNEFLENRWIRVAALNADTAEVRMYRGGGLFEAVSGEDVGLPWARTSAEYIRGGELGDLPVAAIRTAPASAPPSSRPA